MTTIADELEQRYRTAELAPEHVLRRAVAELRLLRGECDRLRGAAPTWTPVAERMPPERTDVLVHTGDADWPVEVAYWTHHDPTGECDWWTAHGEAVHAAAWMPLPAPPETDE